MKHVESVCCLAVCTLKKRVHLLARRLLPAFSDKSAVDDPGFFHPIFKIRADTRKHVLSVATCHHHVNPLTDKRRSAHPGDAQTTGGFRLVGLFDDDGSCPLSARKNAFRTATRGVPRLQRLVNTFPSCDLAPHVTPGLSG